LNVFYVTFSMRYELARCRSDLEAMHQDPASMTKKIVS
jgi:hypothetical protein